MLTDMLPITAPSSGGNNSKLELLHGNMVANTNYTINITDGIVMFSSSGQVAKWTQNIIVKNGQVLTNHSMPSDGTYLHWTYDENTHVLTFWSTYPYNMALFGILGCEIDLT